jgi:hypothetical protein
MESSQSVPQCVVDAGVRNPFQAEAGVVAEFFIGQKGGQRRHRVLGADQRQSLACLGLIERCGVGPQHLSQPVGFDLLRRIIRCRRQVVLAQQVGRRYRKNKRRCKDGRHVPETGRHGYTSRFCCLWID